jgi:hypothetical protein
MEAAGVALGGIPLILIALEKYFRVARILKDYADYDNTLSKLQLNLWIQEEQYDDTLESMGLKDMSLDEIGEHLRQKHPHKCDRFMAIIRRIHHIAEKIAEMLDVGSPDKVSGLFITLAYSYSHLRFNNFSKPRWRQEGEKRFKREMQKIILSLDMEDGELRQRFSELEALNKALRNRFEKMEVPSAETVDNRIVKRLHACFNADHCITANQNARILHGALQAGWGCACPEPHKGGLRLAWHTEKRLSPTNFEMALSYKDPSAGAQQELWQQIKVSITETMTPTSASSQAIPAQATSDSPVQNIPVSPAIATPTVCSQALRPPSIVYTQNIPAKEPLLERITKSLKRVRILEDSSIGARSNISSPSGHSGVVGKWI